MHCFTVRGLFFTVAISTAACAVPAVDRGESPEPVGQTQQAISSSVLDVEFTDCLDLAGITPITVAAARTFVPARFTLAGDGTSAAFVVRTATCGGISVGGHKPEPGSVVQVGVSIVAPDGNLANLNNYTGFYYTDSKRLAKGLEKLGMEVILVDELDLQYTKNAAGTGGTFHLGVHGTPSFDFDGTGVEPVTAPRLFEANWYQVGDHGLVQLDTILPAIAFGSAPVMSLTTSPSSAIGALIGGGSTAFPSFHSFSRSSPEHMHVTVLP